MGIEPTYPAWKAGVLPLNYTRISIGVTGFEPATSWSQTRRSSQAEPHPVFCFCVVISVTQIVLYISPLYMSTTFLNFFQKNSSKYLPYFGKPVKSGFPDLLSSYLYYAWTCILRQYGRGAFAGRSTPQRCGYCDVWAHTCAGTYNRR